MIRFLSMTFTGNAAQLLHIVSKSDFMSDDGYVNRRQRQPRMVPKMKKKPRPRADPSRRRGVIDDTEGRLARQNCNCHFLGSLASVQTTAWGASGGICTDANWD